MNTTEPPNTIGPTVVGMDGSEQSRAALLWAVEHTREDQPIHVVHAFSPITELAMAAAQHDWTSDRQRRADELDNEWIAEARKHRTDLQTSVVDQDPAHALMEKAKACDGVMIVVGPHGSGLGKSLGGATRTLLHDLPVPVVVARRPESTGVPGAKRVLVAVGYGQAIEPAVAWAAEYAQASGCSLELCHVVGYRPIFPFDSPVDMLASYFGGSTPVDWASTELGGLAEEVRQNHPELEVETSVKRGSVVRQTLSRGRGAELIVLGQSHTERVTRNLYASRTLGIVSKASSSVVVVPT